MPADGTRIVLLNISRSFRVDSSSKRSATVSAILPHESYKHTTPTCFVKKTEPMGVGHKAERTCINNTFLILKDFLHNLLWLLLCGPKLNFFFEVKHKTELITIS